MTSVTIDVLIAEVARLKERVKVLEQSRHLPSPEYIEGWAAVAVVLGITDQTAMNRLGRGEFPAPCGRLRYACDGKVFTKPRWRRKDIVAYAEGK